MCSFPHVTVWIILKHINLIISKANEPYRVAVVGASDNTSLMDVQLKLSATGLFGTVTTFDVATTTPLLSDLSSFDSVLVFSDRCFANSTALGDTLAEYVDAGGGLVIAMQAFSLDPCLGTAMKI